MRNLMALAGSLLRGGGRRTVLDLSLTVIGVAIPVAIMLLVVGTVTGFHDREDAMAWREPKVTDPPDAVALQVRRYEPWRGARIDVVELHRLRTDSPRPPGVPRFPADGEIWVSPALGEILADDPEADALTARLGGEVAGNLGDTALAYQDELVAVVGSSDLEPTATEDLAPVDHRMMGAFVPSDVLPVGGFASAGTDPGLPTQYRVAAWIAGTLLVAPSVSLVGAAARLTAARRGRRLAALRLAGATSAQVTLLAVVETGLASLLGIALGSILALAGMGVVTGIPLAGGSFAFSDLVPDPPLWALILSGSLLGAVLAALAGLRRVRATPLGVVRQTGNRRPALRRFLVMILAWAAFIVTVPFTQTTGQYWFLVAGLCLVILSISAVGPLFAWILGWMTARMARRSRTLVAGRRLMADPVGSFRPTTGLILVSFVAGFLLLSSVTLPDSTEGREAIVLGYPNGVTDGATWAEWEAELTELYPGATLEGPPEARLALPDDLDLESERSTIAEVIDAIPLTVDEVEYGASMFADDVRRATWVVVAIALIQAAFATGVGSAASVLEQGTTLAALHLAGTPTSHLQTSRALQAGLPITVGAAIFTTLGALAGAMTIVGISPDTTIVVPSAVQALLVVVASGAAAVGGTELTRPVLMSVLRRPLAER